MTEARRPSAPPQIPTGVPGLDRLLNGGLREGTLHVVVGGPGSGKTVLAHQIGVTMIRAGGKVLYLTALVEAHQTLIAQARTFEFFDPAMVPGSFYYASLYPALAEGRLQTAREEIARLVAQHEPSLVVLDGVHALKAVARDPLDYQRFMHELGALATAPGLTLLLLVHPPAESIAADPTFTVADAIFHMRASSVRLRSIRSFAVGKLRGVAHVGGWHTFRISAAGVYIFPRAEALAADMRAPYVGAAEAGHEQLLSIAVDNLDEMLGGGLDRASITLAVGTPGSGKTLLGLAFLRAGADAGDTGLFLGYHEAPETLMRRAENAGLRVRDAVADGRIHLTWRSSGELLIDEEVERLLGLVREHKVRRLVIDAAEDLRLASLPRQREGYALAALMNLLRGERVTTIVLHNLKRVAGISFDLPLADLSALMDNALHLRYVEQKGEMKRLIAVLKVRARRHDHTLREFHIGDDGLRVGKVLDRGDLIITGLGLNQ